MKIAEREIKIEKFKTRNFTNMQRGRRGGTEKVEIGEKWAYLLAMLIEKERDIEI